MKQITQNLRWLVTLLAMIVSIGAWAESNTTTTSFTLNSNSGNSFTQDGISVIFRKGNGTTTPSWFAAGHRFYANNTITISSNKNITGIIFNWEKQGNKTFASATASDGTYIHPIETGEGVWSGSAKSITFTLGSSGQLQLNTFSVTYDSSDGVSGYTIDFESSLDCYIDWVFTNIGIHNNITAHEGTYYGATVNGNGNAVESATIQTKEKVANPATFTCYVSKESTNTNNSSVWYVQVSSDGENWEDVASQSATSMNKGEWIEVTADLSNYSNVYVRLRYNGTNAIRTVDDISITLRGTPTVATPTFSPAGGSFTGTQSVTISCETTGAVIYYTINGTTPSASNGTLYEDEITISATTTVKAIAIMDNESSEIASATYEKVLLSAGLEYSASSAEVTFGETPYTFPTLSNPNSVTVSYSSLNEAVAKVNANGAVSIEGIGTTTISASFGGNTEYSAGSAQYTLKVNPKISTVIDLVNNESVTFTKDKDSWTSVADSYPTSKTEKQFIGSDGTSTTWSYKKVLKNSDKELQFKAGEGLLTSPNVDCRDGYGYKVTILFTSIASNPNASLVVTASTMETESNHALSTGNDASLSLDVCGWSNVTISTTGTNALYVKEIKFERILVETVDVTISDKAKIDNEYYATFSNSEKALHFGAVKGLKAYIVATAEKESSAITLSEVTKVPANTGLLVCGTTPKTYKVPVISSADEILVNKLYPSTGITGDGKSIYIFANGNKGLGFYIVKNGSSLNSNQAYLKINNGTSSEIKTFFSLGGDYVNDINHIETEILSDNIGLYNLNGQRVTSPVKGGLYIMNGNKVFIK